MELMALLYADEEEVEEFDIYSRSKIVPHQWRSYIEPIGLV